MARNASGIGFVTVTIAIAALVPTSALGSTVAISGSTLKVTDPANVAQATTVSFNAAAGAFGVTDGGGAMSAATPCLPNGAGTAVSCPAAGISTIAIDGAGGIDDLVIDLTVPAPIRGLLRGGPGADVLTGGGGDDVLDGGAGPDTFAGGAGLDSVTYASHPAGPGVRAGVGGGTVSGNGFDGALGARDLITATVEAIVGTASNDRLRGGPGADLLKGQSGLDKINGRGGADRIFGGAERDVLRGDDGPDRLVGGGGRDILSGLDGSDKLFADDGVADSILDCGNGTSESAATDALDPAPVSC